MSRFAQSLILALAALSLHCTARESGAPHAATDAASRPAVQKEIISGPPMPSASGPGVEVRPTWPAGWKVVDSGRAGEDPSPLVWFRLQAGKETPEEAVRQALAAVRPLAGAISMQDAAPARSGAEAVGHFRGARLRGVVQAYRARDLTEARVTLEPSP